MSIPWQGNKIKFLTKILSACTIIAILIFLIIENPSSPKSETVSNVFSLKKNWDYVISHTKIDSNPLRQQTNHLHANDFYTLKKELSGTIWFGKKINLNPNWPEPVLYVSGYFGSLTIFLDDVQISDDAIDRKRIRFSRDLIHTYRMIHIPKNVQNGYVTLRYTHPEGVYGPPVEILLGNKSDILLHSIERNIYKLIIIGFAILSGLFILTVFLYLGKFKYNIESGLGTFLLFIGIFMLAENENVLLFYNNIQFWAVLANISLLMFPFGMIHIFTGVFGTGYRNIISILQQTHRIYFFIGVPVIIAIMFTPIAFFNNSDPISFLITNFIRFFSISYNALLIGGLFAMAVISFTKALQKEKNGFIFTIGILPTVFTAFHDIYIAIDSEFLVTLSHWGISIYLFATILIVGRHHSEKEKKMEDYSKKLFRLENLLKEAEIKTLQDRMDPHFLFNSLNTIYVLSKSDSEQTGRAILSLAENYRFLLEKTGNDLIHFEDEWMFAVNYLLLFQYRYADILETNIHKDGSFQGIMIPPFTIQPLLENIFKHGFRTVRRNWQVSLHAVATNGNVQIRIADNGIGVSPQCDLKNRSIGNIHTRLLHYYPGMEFHMHPAYPMGTEIKIHFTPGKGKTPIEV